MFFSIRNSKIADGFALGLIFCAGGKVNLDCCALEYRHFLELDTIASSTGNNFASSLEQVTSVSLKHNRIFCRPGMTHGIMVPAVV
jgi:hypothetical protein